MLTEPYSIRFLARALLTALGAFSVLHAGEATGTFLGNFLYVVRSKLGLRIPASWHFDNFGVCKLQRKQDSTGRRAAASKKLAVLARHLDPKLSWAIGTSE